MKREEDAVELAEVMVETGERMGKKVVALITDMNQPLGRMAGHSNEIAECLEVLSGGGPSDLRDLSIELSAWMFVLGEKTADVAAGRQLAKRMIASGQAKVKFRQSIALQGGDPRVVEDPERLPQARALVDVSSSSAGFISETNCEQFGIALAILGGGRASKEDRIDPAVGLEFHCRIGDRVTKDQPLVTIHYNSEDKLEEAKALVAAGFSIAATPPRELPELIHRVILPEWIPEGLPGEFAQRPRE
jgi:thymidine phosphorylase